MSQVIVLLSILLLTLQRGSYAQTTVSQSTSSSATASFSISSTQLTSSLEQATAEAVPELESDPQNLDQVLQVIAQAIVSEMEKIAIALIQNSEIDVDGIAVEFGEAVRSALTSITQVEAYEELDVGSVVQQVESSVEGILSEVSTQSDIAKVTENLANAVIGAIGDALADVSGATFSYQVTVSSSRTATSTPAVATTEAAAPSGASALMLLLQVGDIQGVIESMSSQLTSGSEVAVLDFLIQASENSTFQSSLIDVFIEMFASTDFPFQELVEILPLEAQFNPEVFSLVLQGAISAAVAANRVDGLAVFVRLVFQSGSASIQEDVVSSIGAAIKEGECSQSLSKLLASVSSDSRKFQGAIAGDADVSSCTTQGLQLQLSITISAQISSGDVDAAFENIKTADVTTIVGSLIRSLRDSQFTEVSNLLIKFYGDESVTTERLSLVISLLLMQDSQNTTSVIVESITNTQDLSRLIATFTFAFTKAESQVTTEFVKLIAGSVENGSCALSKVVYGVLADASQDEAKAITQLLVNGGAEACVPVAAPPTVEAVPETAPTVEPVTPTPSPIELTPIPTIEPVVELVSPTPTPSPTVEPVLTSPEPEQVKAVKPVSSPSPTPSPVIEDDGCVDVPPPGGYSCEQQAAYGKCVRKWMSDGGFCKNLWLLL
eukprot:TRINITY_DN1679_c0_g1_i1.p1 TRINITY_DN1679_c0_g1~~TRINITY_DN1679_c0_g1_i1.p1  ORF type:complete len:664 (-),score=79.52 TRINITY_DN1679_c0_g1_i1:1029-3020(-)